MIAIASLQPALAEHWVFSSLVGISVSFFIFNFSAFSQLGDWIKKKGRGKETVDVPVKHWTQPKPACVDNAILCGTTQKVISFSVKHADPPPGKAHQLTHSTADGSLNPYPGHSFETSKLTSDTSFLVKHFATAPSSLSTSCCGGHHTLWRHRREERTG